MRHPRCSALVSLALASAIYGGCGDSSRKLNPGGADADAAIDAVAGGDAIQERASGPTGARFAACVDFAHHVPPGASAVDLPTCPGFEMNRFPMLFAATEFGDGVRFRQLGGTMVLAERPGDGGAQTFLVRFSGFNSGTVERSELPLPADAVGYQIRATGEAGSGNSVLACSPAACAIFVRDATDGLRRFASVDPALGSDWDGVSFVTQGAMSNLCVTAPGRMACYVAGVWTTFDPPSPPEKTGLCCPLPPEDVHSVVASYSSASWTAVTTAGQIVTDDRVRSDRGPCCSISSPLGTPVGFQILGCGFIGNLLMMTADALYGTLECGVLN